MHPARSLMMEMQLGRAEWPHTWPHGKCKKDSLLLLFENWQIAGKQTQNSLTNFTGFLGRKLTNGPSGGAGEQSPKKADFYFHCLWQGSSTCEHLYYIKSNENNACFTMGWGNVTTQATLQTKDNFKFCKMVCICILLGHTSSSLIKIIMWFLIS